LRKSKPGLKAKSPAETQTGRKRRAGRLKHLDSGNLGILTLPARRQTAACPSGISRFAGSLLPARLSRLFCGRKPETGRAASAGVQDTRLE